MSTAAAAKNHRRLILVLVLALLVLGVGGGLIAETAVAGADSRPVAIAPAAGAALLDPMGNATGLKEPPAAVPAWPPLAPARRRVWQGEAP